MKTTCLILGMAMACIGAHATEIHGLKTCETATVATQFYDPSDSKIENAVAGEIILAPVDTVDLVNVIAAPVLGNFGSAKNGAVPLQLNRVVELSNGTDVITPQSPQIITAWLGGEIMVATQYSAHDDSVTDSSTTS